MGDEGEYDVLVASLNGDVHAVTQMLAKDKSLIFMRGGGNATPLHGAAFNGHAGLAEILLQNGADPQAMTYSQETAAHWAAALGRRSVLELLITYGIDLSSRDALSQHTALDKAEENGHADVIALLKDSSKIAKLQSRGTDGTVVTPGKQSGWQTMCGICGRMGCIPMRPLRTIVEPSLTPPAS